MAARERKNRAARRMPAIGTNIFMGVEVRAPGLMGRVFRKRDKPAMEKFARENLSELGR